MLKKHHFKFCQPLLDDDDSGFLLNGQLPELNVDDFKATIRILGGEEETPVVTDLPDVEVYANETISDLLSEISRRSSNRDAAEEKYYSQDSFGPTPSMSCSSNSRLDQTPRSRKETPPVEQIDSSSATKGQINTTQDGINNLFAQVRRDA